MTDRTEEQERVEREAHRALEDPDEWDALLEIVGEELPETWRKYADDADSPEEAGACAGAARDMEVAVLLLTRLREQKDELERAAREVRDALQTEIKVDDAPGAIIQWYERMFDRLAAALDESEGRGGGVWIACDNEDCTGTNPNQVQIGDEYGYCQACGGTLYFKSEPTRGEPAHTPDPSEGEVRCDHENTVLDDNVEWCPDCRRVMPEDPEDAEDDGRGEGVKIVAVCSNDECEHDHEYELNEGAIMDPAGCGHCGHPYAIHLRPTHSDADPELNHDAEDVREQSDEELVDALESLARNFCLEAGLGYAPVNLAGLEIKRRLQNRSDADPSGVEDYRSMERWRLMAILLHPEQHGSEASRRAGAEIRRRLRRTEDAGEEKIDNLDTASPERMSDDWLAGVLEVRAQHARTEPHRICMREAARRLLPDGGEGG